MYGPPPFTGPASRKLKAGSSGGRGTPKNSRLCRIGNNPTLMASAISRGITQRMIGLRDGSEEALREEDVRTMHRLQRTAGFCRSYDGSL